MNITIPFSDLYGAVSKLKDKVAPQSAASLSIKALKNNALRKALDNISFEGVSGDTVRIGLSIAKVDLKVVSIENNDIILSYSDAKVLDSIIGILLDKTKGYAQLTGDGKIKVLLGSNPKAAPVFEWVALRSIGFDKDAVRIDAVPVR